MMKQSPKVIFFGNERLATGVTTTAPTLSALISEGYDVAAVVINNDRAVSRNSRRIEVIDIANQHNIPVLVPDRLMDIKQQLADFQAEIGVLVAYGKIVPEEIIGLFPKGIVNIHPSKLPKHRGPTPIESVLLSGEAETAVSLMKLVKAMDAGPVYAQQTIPVPNKITKQELVNEVQKIGSKMIVQHLPGILSGALAPDVQDHSQASYDALLSAKDSVVDWSKSASVLEREIRAFAGWPKSTAQIGKQQVILHQVDVVKTSGNPGEFESTKKELVVYCGEDALKILRLQPLNKKEMPVEAFLAGYPL